MAFLKDLKVTKVSFVRNPANKRKFVLLKSVEEGDANNNGNNKENNVRKEVKAAVVQILKSQDQKDRTPDLVVAELEKVENLSLTDEEKTEVRNSVELLADIVPAPAKKADDADDAEKKKKAKEAAEAKKAAASSDATGSVTLSKAEFEGLKNNAKELKEVQKSLSEIRETAAIGVIRKFLEEEAEFARGDFDVIAKDIRKMEQDDPEMAKRVKQTYVNESAALARARTLDELGGAGEGSETQQTGAVAPYLAAIQKAREIVEKSGKPVDEIALVRNAVKKVGRAAFDKYRREHFRRAQRDVI